MKGADGICVESQLLALQVKQALLLALAVQMRKRSFNVHNYVQQGSARTFLPVGSSLASFTKFGECDVNVINDSQIVLSLYMSLLSVA